MSCFDLSLWVPPSSAHGLTQGWRNETQVGFVEAGAFPARLYPTHAARNLTLCLKGGDNLAKMGLRGTFQVAHLPCERLSPCGMTRCGLRATKSQYCTFPGHIPSPR